MTTLDARIVTWAASAVAKELSPSELFKRRHTRSSAQDTFVAQITTVGLSVLKVKELKSIWKHLQHKQFVYENKHGYPKNIPATSKKEEWVQSIGKFLALPGAMELQPFVNVDEAPQAAAAPRAPAAAAVPVAAAVSGAYALPQAHLAHPYHHAYPTNYGAGYHDPRQRMLMQQQYQMNRRLHDQYRDFAPASAAALAAARTSTTPSAAALAAAASRVANAQPNSSSTPLATGSPKKRPATANNTPSAQPNRNTTPTATTGPPSKKQKVPDSIIINAAVEDADLNRWNNLSDDDDDDDVLRGLRGSAAFASVAAARSSAGPTAAEFAAAMEETLSTMAFGAGPPDETPKSAVELKILSELSQMGFPDKQECREAIRHAVANSAATPTSDTVMLAIITKREEDEEAKKMDQARLLSEQDLNTSTVDGEELRERQRAAAEEKLLQATYTQWLEPESNADHKLMFPGSWLLCNKPSKSLIMDIVNNRDRTEAKKSLVKLLRLEKKAKQWYAVDFAKPYFTCVVGKRLLDAAPEKVKTEIDEIAAEAEEAMLGLKCNQEKDGRPKLFIRAREEYPVAQAAGESTSAENADGGDSDIEVLTEEEVRKIQAENAEKKPPAKKVVELK